MSNNGKSRDDLLRQAALVRSKLSHTVEQLDRRRHEWLDFRRQLHVHLRQFAVGGALLTVVTAGAVTVLVHRASTAAQRRREQRWVLARRLWRHPDRALRAERGPFLMEVVRSLLLTLVTSVATLPVRRVFAELAQPAR